MKKRAQKKLVEHLSKHYKRIEVEDAGGMFNYRCYFNAAQYAVNMNHSHIAEVMLVDKITGSTTLHYINEGNGIFYETTLGFLCNNYDYYLLRYIGRRDFPDVYKIFINSVDYWTNLFTNSFIRFLFNIDRIV